MPMPFEPDIQTGFIILLTAAVLICLLRIVRLSRLLREERHRRFLPLITAGIDSIEEGLYLKNTGGVPAKDITVGDVEIELDYGFKKYLRLSFRPLDRLAPDEKKPLAFEVFDKEYQVHPEDAETLAGHIKTSPLTLHLRYTNMQNVPFRALLRKDKDRVTIEEAGPESEN